MKLHMNVYIYNEMVNTNTNDGQLMQMDGDGWHVRIRRPAAKIGGGLVYGYHGFNIPGYPGGDSTSAAPVVGSGDVL